MGYIIYYLLDAAVFDNARRNPSCSCFKQCEVRDASVTQWNGVPVKAEIVLLLRICPCCRLLQLFTQAFVSSNAKAVHISKPRLISPLPSDKRGLREKGRTMGRAKEEGGASELEKVDLVRLLGCCVIACERAAKVIREVEKKRRNSSTGSIEGAVLKDAMDPRSYLTEADTAAQKVIMKTLRSTFPAVTIIGEEEEEGEGEDCGAFSAEDVELAMARLEREFEGAPAEVRAVAATDVCVFVDPVDGTKEFVEGRLEAVQTLVGVALKGKSIAGAIGIPFLPPYTSSASADVDVPRAHVMYGLALGGFGAKNIPQPTGERPALSGLVLVASPSAKEPAVKAAKEALVPAAVITPGGVGNKILSVLRGDADCALMHLATSLWDTCAPGTAALLRFGSFFKSQIEDFFTKDEKETDAFFFGVLLVLSFVEKLGFLIWAPRLFHLSFCGLFSMCGTFGGCY